MLVVAGALLVRLPGRRFLNESFWKGPKEGRLPGRSGELPARCGLPHHGLQPPFLPEMTVTTFSRGCAISLS